MSEGGHQEDFLVLHYEQQDFLCRKSDFSASNIVDVARSVKTSVSSVFRLVRFGPHEVPDFDLNGLLQSLFPALEPRPSNLSLLVRSEVLGLGPEGLGQYLEDPVPPNFRADLVSLSVSSDSDVRRIPLAELHLLPHLIREPLGTKGFLGIRPLGDRLQYLIDIPLLVRPWLVPEAS